tara:strand:- start:1945 stop:2373 length:429 start_codon:yes stop_codon:yes gene_type:complete
LKGGRKQSIAMYNEYLEIARPRMGGSAAEASMGANVTNMEISTFDLDRSQRGLQAARDAMEQHLNRATVMRNRADRVMEMRNREEITMVLTLDQINETMLSISREIDAAQEALTLVNFYRAEVAAAEAREAGVPLIDATELE